MTGLLQGLRQTVEIAVEWLVVRPAAKRVLLGLLVALPGCGSSEPAISDDYDELALGASEFGSPSPLAPPQTAHWGKLAGVWDCLINTPGQSGVSLQSRATWTWRYVLDGHAVQDVYEGLRSDGSPSFYGTGLRIFHPHSDQWEISWTANSAPSEGVSRIAQFTATSDENRIVMRRGNGEPEWRTVFYDITRETFAWMSEPSGQTMTCRRRVG